jgi:hypothetical protein
VKVQDKFVAAFLLCGLIMASCTQKKNIFNFDIIEKISNFDGVYPISIGSFSASDGIKVMQSNKVDYFIFDIKLIDGIIVCPSGVKDEYSFYISDDICPYNIPYRAEMQFIQKTVVNDSIIKEKVFEILFDSIYPSYWANTLNVFKSGSQYGAYFYTSLVNYPSGFDPSKVVLWVFYNDKFYQIKGIVPQHEDWTWEEYYSVTFSKELEQDFPEIYDKMKGLWNSQMERYRKKMISN